ncbi:MAG: response regulator transcription factor [Candidatus Eremiobacteraeota bacterium]|nr:response regulator transcription factor [Candidatus Eremiobacteraeota bacterium]
MGKEGETQKIGIILVEDHRLVREGFANMLSLQEDFEVKGEATTAEEAFELIRKYRPDIVLMDIKLPGMNGIEATKQIKKEFPDVEVIMLSMYDEDQYVLESVRAGATGYVLKDISQEELFNAINVVYRGGSLIQPYLARKVLDSIAKGETTEKARTSLRQVSDREVEVLQCVAEGLTNKEIAEKLFISEKTVKAHLRSIFRKLEVGDRAHAVAYAMRRGWVE